MPLTCLRAATAFAAVWAMLVSGCARLTGEPASRTKAPPVTVQGLLQQRIGKLKAGDIGAYLAPLSAGARAVERPIAQGALSDPVDRASLTATAGQEAARGLSNVPVRLGYRYSGLPAGNEFAIGLVYDFRRSGRSLTVGSAALQSEGRGLPLWAAGPVKVERTGHFLGVSPPDAGRTLETLGLAEDALKGLERTGPAAAAGPYLIQMANGEEQYRRMSQGQVFGGGSDVAQVEASFEVTTTRFRFSGWQVIVDLASLYRTGRPRDSLRHELAHLALLEATRPHTPAWLQEGAAVYLAGVRPADAWRRGSTTGLFDGLSLEGLEEPAQLGPHQSDGGSGSAGYAYSAAACWYLAEQFSEGALWEFYRSFAGVSAQQLYRRLPGRGFDPADPAIRQLGDEGVREGLQRLFGLTVGELDLRVRQWIPLQSRRR